MAQAVSLTVAIADGTILPSTETVVFPVDSIKSPVTSAVSAGTYNVGIVNSLIYADTGFGIKAYYVTEDPSEVETKMNA